MTLGRPARTTLVVHGDRTVRRSVVDALRAIGATGPVSEASSVEEGLGRARSLSADLVLLDLDERGSVALEAARELTRAGRRVVGLYDPLLPPAADAARLRAAVRAGVADFVPLPPAAADLAAAIAGVAPAAAAIPLGRVIAFVSAKGGAGTTTLMVNAAAALGDTGADVVVVDGAVPFGDAAEMLGLTPSGDLLDLAATDEPGPWAAHLDRAPGSNVACLASPQDPRRASEMGPDDLTRVILRLRRDFEWVLVDLAAGFDLLTLAALELADVCCVVTEAVPATLGRTARLLALLDDLGVARERRRLVVNRHASEWCVEGRVIVERLGESPQLVVPFDRAVPAGSPRAVPAVLERPRSEVARAVQRLVEILAAPAETGAVG